MISYLATRVANSDDPLGIVSSGIMRHPRFDEAWQRYISDILDWRREIGIFNRIGTDTSMHVMEYLMFLHFANPTGRAEDGATFTRLVKMCEERDTCGSRAVRTTLAIAQMAGHLRAVRATGDRRISAYEPTERLMAQTRRWYARTFATLDMLTENGGYAHAAANDPAFIPHLVQTARRSFLDLGLRITDQFPELHALLRLGGGFPTTVAAVDAHLRALPCPTPSVIAREFHVSPSQVRGVFRAAAQRGLVTLSASGEVIDAGPLAREHKACMARELALYAKYTFGLEPYFAGMAGQR